MSPSKQAWMEVRGAAHATAISTPTIRTPEPNEYNLDLNRGSPRSSAPARRWQDDHGCRSGRTGGSAGFESTPTGRGTGSVPTGTIIIANGIYADTDSATTPTYTAP